MAVARAKRKTTLSNIVVRGGSGSPATYKMELFVTNLELKAFNYCRKELDFRW